MVLVLAWDADDNFVCSMNFPSMDHFDDFNENVSFDEPLSFEIIDFDDKAETLQ